MELDLGIAEVMHMFTDIASDVSMYWIGLEIGMGHFLCVILFEDIDKVVREGIGI